METTWACFAVNCSDWRALPDGASSGSWIFKTAINDIGVYRAGGITCMVDDRDEAFSGSDMVCSDWANALYWTGRVNDLCRIELYSDCI